MSVSLIFQFKESQFLLRIVAEYIGDVIFVWSAPQKLQKKGSVNIFVTGDDRKEPLRYKEPLLHTVIAPVASDDSVGICIIFSQMSASWKKTTSEMYVASLTLLILDFRISTFQYSTFRYSSFETRHFDTRVSKLDISILEFRYSTFRSSSFDTRLFDTRVSILDISILYISKL